MKLNTFDLERFVRMRCISAAFELGTTIRDVKSGFATQNDLDRARREVKMLYQLAKVNQISGLVLPILKSCVTKYRS